MAVFQSACASPPAVKIIHFALIYILLTIIYGVACLLQGFPVIPRLSNPLDGHSLLNTETLWILSTILPPCFLGSVAQKSNSGGPQATTTDERKAKPLERVSLPCFAMLPYS